ncbi:FadR/GntR family transcriptional regulator [Nakamurella endophytica]|uniref:HTH gntR-type domain-containing protein n=1 Tax=Nakamurella endophytica TaxID=1748367 RepID=A0A917WMK6_9ACTN|nr:FCD domain-containing protein [Nakamurella endophytica]GGM14541.1 hypothetical protein GCM10011594_38260 [Nakamurella endophytica]
MTGAVAMAEPANERGTWSSHVTFDEIKAHRTFESVIEQITDQIDANGLGAGSRLPHESVMAEKMSVSRPTVRQALKILQASGVLEIRAGKSGGVFVASDMIPVNLLAQNIAHEVDHVSELVATRRLVEPIVVHLAAENASADELDRIEATIGMMGRHADNPVMVERADGMFHRRIAHAAGNKILLRTISNIYKQLIPMRHSLSYEVGDAERMIAVHGRQMDALRARDHVRLDEVLGDSFVTMEEELGVQVHHSLRWVTERGPTGS